MVAGGAWETDLEELAAAEIGPSHVPLHTARGHRFADPQPRPDLERLPLHAQRLAPLAGVTRVLLEHEHLHSALRQAPGQRHPDGAGTDDRDLGVEPWSRSYRCAPPRDLRVRHANNTMTAPPIAIRTFAKLNPSTVPMWKRLAAM